MSKHKKQVYLSAWRARMFLRVHGHLTDSENNRIVDRLQKYAVKNKLSLDKKDYEKQKLI